ncbi:hypothetical protein P5673_020139 [Acropora cervicornis]|uniref:Uncharacterized protein n=1 Tax=Acropora cervicornis TaxID=6130 RepID=A0AAD9QAR2_ACRCE|nr:hypothetical protein P5673_020139 [Acropora cervicornis]
MHKNNNNNEKLINLQEKFICMDNFHTSPMTSTLTKNRTIAGARRKHFCMETHCLERENVFTSLRGKLVWFFQKVQSIYLWWHLMQEMGIGGIQSS